MAADAGGRRRQSEERQARTSPAASGRNSELDGGGIEHSGDKLQRRSELALQGVDGAPR